MLSVSLVNGCKYRDKIWFFAKDVQKKCYFRFEREVKWVGVCVDRDRCNATIGPEK